jgi:hypothetical protein
VFTEVSMKNAIFWDVAPCRSCVNQRFRGTYCLHFQLRKIRQRSLLATCSCWFSLCSPCLFSPPWQFSSTCSGPPSATCSPGLPSWSLQNLPLSSLLISHVLHSPSLCSYTAGCFQLVVQSVSHLLMLVPWARIFLPWRCRQYVPLKRQFTQDLHCVTSQKTVFFNRD